VCRIERKLVHRSQQSEWLYLAHDNADNHDAYDDSVRNHDTDNHAFTRDHDCNDDRSIRFITHNVVDGESWLKFKSERADAIGGMGGTKVDSQDLQSLSWGPDAEPEPIDGGHGKAGPDST
jgi:hypothetical protein